MEFGERIWRGPPVCPSDEAEQQEPKQSTPAGASSSQIESPDSEPRKRRDVRVGRPLLEGAPGLWRVRVARVHVWFRFCPRCVDWRQHLLSAPLVSFVGTLLRSGVHRDARRIRACARLGGILRMSCILACISVIPACMSREARARGVARACTAEKRVYGGHRRSRPGPWGWAVGHRHPSGHPWRRLKSASRLVHRIFGVHGRSSAKSRSCRMPGGGAWSC